MGFHAKVLPWAALRAWRDEQSRGGRKVVVTNGCFDILHVGHATYLEAAAALGDVLLVGVNGDGSVRKLKGPNRPVNLQEDRAALVAALGSVGAVCVFEEPSAERFLEAARPDVWVKGGDYTAGTVHQGERGVVEAAGGTLAFIPLVPGRSTTTTLERMKGSE